MGLLVRYEGAGTGNTVPYPPLHDEIRNNRGFVDLRGKPETAKTIAEGLEAPELQLLLVDLATQGSPLFSLGCDIGAHRETRGAKGRREVAGGYVQVIGSDYAKLNSKDYLSHSKAIAADMRRQIGRDDWKITFALVPVQLNLDDFNEIVPSVEIWFWARSASPNDAVLSRQRLLNVLRKALSMESNAQPKTYSP
ncbi:MAG: hypothetical protein ABSA58_20380 [Acetobacteraceae bacterium]